MMHADDANPEDEAVIGDEAVEGDDAGDSAGPDDEDEEVA